MHALISTSGRFPHFVCLPPKAARRAVRTAAALAPMALGLTLGCGAAEELTYTDDILPLFDARCVTCHQLGAPAGPPPGIGVDVIDAYAQTGGIVTAKNTWKEARPEIDSPEYNVVPGDPDDSFLVHKLSDPSLNLLLDGDAGDPMPVQFAPLSDAERASIERWILEGAADTEQFRAEVIPILGNTPGSFGMPNGRVGKCLYCHYEGASTPLDLTDPFGPDGLVNVPGVFRPDMARVVPGDPEQSFLIAKIRTEVPNSRYGAPMPLSYPMFSTAELDLVREWILQGARP